MTRASTLVLIAGLAVGCGGGKQADTTPTGGGAEAEPVRGGGGGGGMVAPEKMDEVERSLDRKAVMISRCLSVAVDNKELPKNAQGKVTLEIVTPVLAPYTRAMAGLGCPLNATPIDPRTTLCSGPMSWL